MAISNILASRLKSKYGNTALITGASSGIGKALAMQLAKANFNLIITGRNSTKLIHLAEEIKTNENEIKVIPGDLSKEEDVYTLIDLCKDIPIGIAILNAGFGTSGKFENSVLENELNMLDLNCKSVLILSHYFAKIFAAQNSGAIILMSSLVAFQGVPNAAHYSATKAYVQTLGEALSFELKPSNVDVLTAAPGPVNTGFSERANMKMGSAPSAEEIATPIIKAIGKQSHVVPGLLSKILTYSLRMTPRFGKIRIMNKVMSGFTKHQIN